MPDIFRIFHFFTSHLKREIAMKLISEEKDGQTFLKISGDISVYEVRELRDELIAHLKAHSELTLDLSEVTDCDTAGVQLLYSARITAESEDKPFLIRGASPQLVNAVTFVGLNPSEVLNVGEGV